MNEQLQEVTTLVRKPAPARWPRWRVIIVAGVIAVSGMLALVGLRRPSADDSRFTVVEQDAAPQAASADPLTQELLRCRALPPQVDDPACRAAWEANRRRFFGEPNVAGAEVPPSHATVAAPSATDRSAER